VSTPPEVRLRALPLPEAWALLAGTPNVPEGLRYHPDYPSTDTVDALAMLVSAHEAISGPLREAPAWWLHQIVVDGLVVGDGGFHGPPTAAGEVEIGYQVVPGWRRRGVATRVCRLLLELAWADGAAVVQAETTADNRASQGVLRRTGFRRRADGVYTTSRPET
jgi:RimJ/RimL family protein N-acetyltransferase